jgi:hypothetical protein
MATAGHRSMSTTKQYLHLAGVVFRQDADALERRLLGDSGVAVAVDDQRSRRRLVVEVGVDDSSRVSDGSEA